MNVIALTYDLRKPGRDYTKVYDYLKAQADWCHPLESVWVIRTTKTAEIVRNEVVRLIDVNDGLLCIDVTGDSMAWQGLGPVIDNWLMTKTRWAV